MDSLDGRRALVTGASSGIGSRDRARAGDGAAPRSCSPRAARHALDAIAAELGCDRGDRRGSRRARRGAESLWTQAASRRADRHPRQQRRVRLLPPVRRRRLGRATPSCSSSTSMSLVELSRRFVADRAEGRRGYLLNVASIAAYQSVPILRGLRGVEGVRAQLHRGAARRAARHARSRATCICPGGTHTEFHGAAGAGDYGWLANASMLGADTVASIAVRAMASAAAPSSPASSTSCRASACGSSRAGSRSWCRHGAMHGQAPRTGTFASRASAA